MIKALSIFVLTCASFLSRAQVNIITTIAGTGVHGYNGDTIPATSAQLNWPSNIRADKIGNLLVVDPDNARIRKIDGGGIITTIAGNGTAGPSGDNGLAINAQLNAPTGICVDTFGNIYIADGLNYKIRKIDASSGIITTIAGTGVAGYSGDSLPAINAQMNTPCGIFVYNEFLYLSDYYNNVVRKINLSTGIITTVAGTGAVSYFGDGGLAINAQFNGVLNVFCDGSGNLFIADQFNGAVRKVDVATGIIKTVAGNGTLGYMGDNGPATSAEMHEPNGIFVDAHNNIFIADYRNGAIRRVDGTTGIITTVAGGAPGYCCDNGPATNAKLNCTDVWVDNAGAIYIADYPNHRVRRVNNALKVEDLTQEKELALYPNPTKGKFVVQSAINEALITIINTAGQQIYQAATFSSKTEVDISNQPKGIYLVFVQSGTDKYVSKILVE